MNSILKKTLIAAAVVGAASANAATITTNVADSAFLAGTNPYPLVSQQGYDIVDYVEIGTTAATQLGVNFTASSAGYNTGDFVRFTVTGASIDTTNSTGPMLTATTGTGALEFVSYDGTSTLVFRVGNTPVSSSAVFAMSGVRLTDAAGAVTMSAAVSAAGETFDTATAKTIGMVASEYTVRAGTEKLNGVIDVEQERKQFTGSSVTDEFEIDVVNGADVYSVSNSTFSVTLKGTNLEFLVDEEGDLETSNFTLAGGTASSDADDTFVNADYTEFKVTSTANYTSTGTDDFGLTLTVDGVADANAQVLTDQSFTADVALNYSYQIGAEPTTSDTITTSGISVGAWTLSGKTVNIPYMPYGSGISQIIYVSNSGSVSGDIELTAFDDAGNTYGPVTITQKANADAITALSASIRAALEAEGYDGSSKKMDLTLVINSPSGDIDVFGAYNVRGDRLAVTVQ